MKRLMMMLGLLLCCVGVAFGEIAITRQPETQTVRAGGKVTFTVKATGAAKQAVTWYFTDPATGKTTTGRKLSSAVPGVKVKNPNTLSITLRNVPETMHGWTLYCHIGKKGKGVDSDEVMILIEGLAADGAEAAGQPGGAEAAGEGAADDDEALRETGDAETDEADEAGWDEAEADGEPEEADGIGADESEEDEDDTDETGADEGDTDETGADEGEEDETGADGGEPDAAGEDAAGEDAARGNGAADRIGETAAASTEIRGFDDKAKGKYQFLTLGTYYYTEDGAKAPLVWRILNREGNLLQLITEYIIDVRQLINIEDYTTSIKHKFKSRFDEKYEDMDIYRWLNGEMASAILEDQDFSAAIVPHRITESIKGGPYVAEALAWPDEETLKASRELSAEEQALYPYGKNLFYIMTYADMMNEENGFPHTLSGNAIEQPGEVAIPEAGRRKAFATPYALNVVQHPEWRKNTAMSKLKITVWAEYGGSSPYWAICRRPGYYMVGIVGGNGHLSWRSMASVMIGVRPATIVDLSGLKLAGGSGTLKDPWRMEVAE